MTVSEGATPFEGSMASDPLAPMAGALATETTGDPGLEILTGTLPSPAARVTRHLNAEGPRIIANWALRVANLPAFRAVPDLGLAQLQDAIPDLLAA